MALTPEEQAELQALQAEEAQFQQAQQPQQPQQVEFAIPDTSSMNMGGLSSQEQIELQRLIAEEQNFQQPGSQQDMLGAAEAALQGFGQAATLGYLPQLQAGVSRILPDPTGGVDEALEAQGFQIQDTPETFVSERDRFIERGERLEEEYPGASLAGQAAGALTAGIATGGIGSLGKAATVGQRLKTGIKTGAVLGFLENPGDTEGVIDPIQFKERVGNAIAGAALGGVFQGVIDGAGGGVKLLRSMPGKVNNFSELKAVRAAGALSGRMKKLIERKQANKLGRRMIDDGLVATGDSIDTIAKKTELALQDTGERIGSIYDDLTNDLINKINKTTDIDVRATRFRPVTETVEEAVDPTISRFKRFRPAQESIEDIAQGKTYKEALDDVKAKATKLQEDGFAKEADELWDNQYSALQDRVDDAAQRFMPSQGEMKKQALKEVKDNIYWVKVEDGVWTPMSRGKTFSKITTNSVDSINEPSKETGFKMLKKEFEKRPDYTERINNYFNQEARRKALSESAGAVSRGAQEGKVLSVGVEDFTLTTPGTATTRDVTKVLKDPVNKTIRVGGLKGDALEMLEKTALNPETIRQNAMKEIREEFKGLADSTAGISKVESLFDEFKEMGDNLNIRDVQKFRRSIDDIINFDREFSKQTVKGKALIAVRNKLNEAIENRIGFFDKVLGSNKAKDLKKYNKAYSELAQINDMTAAEKARQAANQTFGLSEKLLGGSGLIAGTTIGGPVGGIALAVGGAFASKALRRYGNAAAADLGAKLARKLPQNPTLLGKYGGKLIEAARRSPQEYVATIEMFMNDPEFKEATKGLK